MKHEISQFQRMMSPFMSAKCYDEFFYKFNFMNVACLKATASKGLGWGIVAGSILLRVPQILKILGKRSGEGISVLSEILMVVAIFGSMAYGYHKQFPLAAYGDAYFLFVQSVLILTLILYFKRSFMLLALCTGFIASFTGLLYYDALTSEVIVHLNSSSVAFSLVSKLIQIFVNFKNSSTGALSSISLYLQFLGTAARIFTSIQETNDANLILQYVIMTVANGLLVAQLLYYAKPPASKIDNKKKN